MRLKVFFFQMTIKSDQEFSANNLIESNKKFCFSRRFGEKKFEFVDDSFVCSSKINESITVSVTVFSCYSFIEKVMSVCQTELFNVSFGTVFYHKSREKTTRGTFCFWESIIDRPICSQWNRWLMMLFFSIERYLDLNWQWWNCKEDENELNLKEKVKMTSIFIIIRVDEWKIKCRPLSQPIRSSESLIEIEKHLPFSFTLVIIDSFWNRFLSGRQSSQHLITLILERKSSLLVLEYFIDKHKSTRAENKIDRSDWIFVFSNDQDKIKGE